MLTVLSGGQTGADRAALDAAIAAGVPYEGWCPKGGWAEDMPEPPGLLAFYPNLRETPSASPEQRTDWNVRDSGGLLVLTGREGLSCSRGTARALAYAKTLGKLSLVVDVADPAAHGLAWNFLLSLKENRACIAGPRESELPGLYGRAAVLLNRIFETLSSED